MTYNFDEIIPRGNTDCVKFDLLHKVFGTKDVLPMWVADMDFRTPDFIVDAIRNRTLHPIFGYPVKPDTYYSSQVEWLEKRHRWSIKKEWILFCQGVVPALNLIIHAYTNPGDKVIVQPPVYFPFFSAIKNNRRVQVDNPLRLENGRYIMDMEDLKRKIDPKTRMIFLCHPHNPGGRSWTKDELRELVAICMKYGILIISDEIHSDLMLPGYKHTPVASLSPEISEHVITCIAPSKTFNIAGLGTSSVIISNPTLRKKLHDVMERIHIGMGNIFGITSSVAAYSHGEEWLGQLMEYVQGNMDLVVEYCETHIPMIKPMKPEATYLVWLDCRELGLNDTELKDFMIRKARLGFNDGPSFGKGGEGFQRMNVGCPRSIVREALNRLEHAISKSF